MTVDPQGGGRQGDGRQDQSSEQQDQDTTQQDQDTAQQDQDTTQQGQATAQQGQATAQQGQATAQQGQATAQQGQGAAQQGQGAAQQGQGTAQQGQGTAQQGQGGGRPPPPPPPPTITMPEAAPVTPLIQQTAPDLAPVRPAETQLGVGSRLAERLLLIVAGSIVVLVIYLAVLDSITSSQVTHVYDETFAQMRAIAIPHDASGADGAARILERASRDPNAPVPSADASKTREVVEALKQSKHLSGENASRMDRCISLMSASRDARPSPMPSPTTPSPAPSPMTKAPGDKSTPDVTPTTAKCATTNHASPAPTCAAATPKRNSTPVSLPSPKAPSSPPAAPPENNERTAAFADCVQILAPLRQVTAGQTADLDRLRLMKEYALDAHQHRQAFRSFWLQAAQLVLLNLLLPLLTALLGYIFGSRQA